MFFALMTKLCSDNISTGAVDQSLLIAIGNKSVTIMLLGSFPIAARKRF